MFPSASARAALAGTMLLLQAATAPSALAIGRAAITTELEWSAPLDSSTLSEVAALGMADLDRDAAPPIPIKDSSDFLVATNREAVTVQIAAIELPRSSATAWATLGEIAKPGPGASPGTTQTETNLTLAVTLNGMTNFAQVRQ